MQVHSTTGRPAEDPESLPQNTPSTLKFFGQFVLVVMVVISVIVAGCAIVVWSFQGGTEYHANDWTVRNARRAADDKARTAVDHVVADLAPALGQPTRRAMIDHCSRSTEIFSNSLGCMRYLYLYYPVTETVPDAATIAGRIPTTRWPLAMGGTCYVDPGVTRACRRTADSRLVVQVNGPGTSSYDRYPEGTYSTDAIEHDGIPELMTAVDSGPCVLVLYATTYFSD